MTLVDRLSRWSETVSYDEDDEDDDEGDHYDDMIMILYSHYWCWFQNWLYDDGGLIMISDGG